LDITERFLVMNLKRGRSLRARCGHCNCSVAAVQANPVSTKSAATKWPLVTPPNRPVGDLGIAN